jgi:glyoxylase-like metal-dependent hydrolase (beta-lactamase superfamily II)
VIDRAPGHPHIDRIVAPNPGPMTLEGTNTFVVERGGRAYVIDPGPAHVEHLDRVRRAGEARGGIAGVLLTHSHDDHSEGAPLLGEPILWPTERPREGPGPLTIGPFEAVATPGHSDDHVVFRMDTIVFCGDLVLGEGSTFVPPDGGSLVAYLASLERLRELRAELLCPGHGPWITDPRAKIDQYIEHKAERDRKLSAAYEAGERSRARLLAAAWDDVPDTLRGAAAIVMQAHVEKLASEGRLDPAELTD